MNGFERERERGRERGTVRGRGRRGVRGWAGTLLILVACAEQPTALPTDVSGPAVKVPADTGVVVYQQVRDWPALGTDLQLGEVAGVDVDSHGHVFIFQRSARGWNTLSTTPIPEPTVWQLDAAAGRVLATWGAGQFLLPHGLTIDRDDNIWLTDAALHQAFSVFS